MTNKYIIDGIDVSKCEGARENVLGEYKKGDFICDVYDMDKGTIEIIKAPFDGILYDVDENIYSYSGKPFGIYGRKIEY